MEDDMGLLNWLRKNWNGNVKHKPASGLVDAGYRDSGVVAAKSLPWQSTGDKMRVMGSAQHSPATNPAEAIGGECGDLDCGGGI